MRRNGKLAAAVCARANAHQLRCDGGGTPPLPLEGIIAIIETYAPIVWLKNAAHACAAWPHSLGHASKVRTTAVIQLLTTM
jgi:hypothetical protein